jgi:hypothetical protein
LVGGADLWEHPTSKAVETKMRMVFIADWIPACGGGSALRTEG